MTSSLRRGSSFRNNSDAVWAFRLFVLLDLEPMSQSTALGLFNFDAPSTEVREWRHWRAGLLRLRHRSSAVLTPRFTLVEQASNERWGTRCGTFTIPVWRTV